MAGFFSIDIKACIYRFDNLVNKIPSIHGTNYLKLGTESLGAFHKNTLISQNLGSFVDAHPQEP